MEAEELTLTCPHCATQYPNALQHAGMTFTPLRPVMSLCPECGQVSRFEQRGRSFVLVADDM